MVDSVIDEFGLQYRSWLVKGPCCKSRNAKSLIGIDTSTSKWYSHSFPFVCKVVYGNDADRTTG